jgi:hypothetical protein
MRHDLNVNIIPRVRQAGQQRPNHSAEDEEPRHGRIREAGGSHSSSLLKTRVGVWVEQSLRCVGCVGRRSGDDGGVHGGVGIHERRCQSGRKSRVWCERHWRITIMLPSRLIQVLKSVSRSSRDASCRKTDWRFGPPEYPIRRYI